MVAKIDRLLLAISELSHTIANRREGLAGTGLNQLAKRRLIVASIHSATVEREAKIAEVLKLGVRPETVADVLGPFGV